MSVVYSSLYWLLLAVPIVGFYLLKVRLRRVPVSTLMFWQRVYDEKQPRSMWRQLRHVGSLLLQLLFLVLVVAGLCDPQLAGETRERARTILVVDNSGSMSASDMSPNRLTEAKRRAAELVGQLRAGDEMAVVVAGAPARVVCGLTEHPGSLSQSIESIRETDGPTAIAVAVETAERLLAGHSRGNVVVISDGCFPGAEALLVPKAAQGGDAARTSGTESEAFQRRWIRIGESQPNVAITRFQVRRSVMDPLGFQVFCEVSNFSPFAVQTNLELSLGDDLLDVIPLKLDAGGRWSQTLEKASERGGELRARVEHVDVLPSDNLARAVLPERTRQKVTLVGSGNVFLQRVFEANDLVELTQSEDLPTENPQGALVVLHRRVPQELPSGNVLVLQPETGCSLWELGERLDHPLVGQQDKASPLLANVRLENVLMPEARLVRPIAPAKVLIESASGEPLLLIFEHARGRVVLLTVNLERGDLTLRTAFPILVANVLSWLEGAGGELRESLATGEVRQISIPERLASSGSTESKLLRLESPRGEMQEVIALRGKAAIGPLSEAGIWKLRAGTQSGEDSDSMLLACSATNAEESNLTAPTIASEQARIDSAAGGRFVWFYLVLLAWILTGLEWGLHQRRVVS